MINSIFDKQPWLRWIVCGAISTGLAVLTVAGGLQTTSGTLLMPLDDTYIHFQYAHQLAAAQPYIYNPGLPATSGATSFLYPYLLALGDWIGFRGLNLALWAVLIGCISLTGSMILIHRLSRSGSASEGIAWVVTLAFAGGASAWHAFSGMETMLVVLLTLLTFQALWDVWESSGDRHLRLLVASSCALTLVRPEGGWLALGAVISAGWVQRALLRKRPRLALILILPVAALAVQPVVNLVLTGSAVASGNAAKSIFGSVPFDLPVVLARWIEQMLRIGWEALSGIDARGVWYVLPLLPLLAVAGIVRMPRVTRNRMLFILLVWLGGGAVLVATLDTAFWHFKRYQMPLLALLFPLAGWGLARLGSFGRLGRWSMALLSVVWVCSAMLIALQFHSAYQLNVGYVYAQPYRMARWLSDNTPIDTTVAVHDTGMMRYQGERTTIDMVGLTTPGAAEYWRSGPGAVAEFLMRRRPGWIASYGPGHGFGLGMLAETSLYGEPAAAFEVELDERFNVALAAGFQGIYQPDWTAADRRTRIWQPSSLQYSADMQLMDSLNVADVADEQAHGYTWSGVGDGFPTEVHEANYMACSTTDCRVVDGGRRLLREQFRLRLTAGQDAVLVTRVLPAGGGGVVEISIDGQFLARRWVPDVPGQWVEIPVLIPAAAAQAETWVSVTTISGTYAPYAHFAYQGIYQPVQVPSPDNVKAVFQGGAIMLQAESPVIEGRRLMVPLSWYSDGTSSGDYVVFVHVSSAPDDPPLAQADGRSGGGALPPGNWLPAVISDTFMVDLSKLDAGKYWVMAGFYNPSTGERLLPDEGGTTGDSVVLGEIEIQ